MAEVITPMVLLLTVFLLVFSLQHAHFSHIRPVLADNWHPILRSSILPWTFSTEILLAIPLARHVKGDPIRIRDGIVFGLSLALTGVFIELVVISVLGSTIEHSAYPILEVVRSISSGQFFEHLDPLYVVTITLTILLKLSVIHYSWVVEAQQLFRFASYRPLVWSTGFLAWAGTSFLFRDVGALNEFMLYAAFAYFLCTVPATLTLALSVDGIRNLIQKARTNTGTRS